MDLDIENFPALMQYLHTTARIPPTESPRLTNLAGGVSNRTVLLQRPTGESWVLKQALERLRVQAEWHSDPRRIEREALGIQTLAHIAPPGSTTPLIFLDATHHLLAMQAVPQPHENWKSMLMSGRIDPDHVRQFARLLASIHSAGFQRHTQFAPQFDDRTYFESLRLEPYYLYSAQRMPAVESFINQLVADTRATRYTLVHGDYSPKNVLVHNNRLVLLDHEVIHFGDGAFDLGFALTHFLSKAHALPAYRARFVESANLFWQTYGAAVIAPDPDALESRAVRHTLGCLLARCVGRSPLEYLAPPLAAKQANAASALMDNPPTTIESLISAFVARL